MSNDRTGRQLIPSIDIKMTPLLSACLCLMLIFWLVGNTRLHADSGFGKVQFKNRFVGAFETEQEQYQVNNWADLSYRYNTWRTGLRFEYHDPKNSGLYNERVTQRFIEFKDDWIRVKAGNFYEKLGRGLIFHAYEIQSDALDRTDINIAIDRNIDGVNLKLLFDKVELTGIWGKPLRFLSSEQGRTSRWRGNSGPASRVDITGCRSAQVSIREFSRRIIPDRYRLFADRYHSGQFGSFWRICPKTVREHHFRTQMVVHFTPAPAMRVLVMG